jgi:hypothetical protein
VKISKAIESLFQIECRLLILLTSYCFAIFCCFIFFKNSCAVNFKKLALVFSFPFILHCFQMIFLGWF